ncbi:MAG: hypothetical protein AAF914_14810, partial [Pseudomonadota bacterium]
MAADVDRLPQTTADPDQNGTGRVLVLACGALAREIVNLRTLNDWTHLDLVCLPAILHNTPDRIPDAVADAVARHRPHYSAIFVAYG